MTIPCKPERQKSMQGIFVCGCWRHGDPPKAALGESDWDCTGWEPVRRVRVPPAGRFESCPADYRSCRGRCPINGQVQPCDPNQSRETGMGDSPERRANHLAVVEGEPPTVLTVNATRLRSPPPAWNGADPVSWRTRGWAGQQITQGCSSGRQDGTGNRCCWLSEGCVLDITHIL